MASKTSKVAKVSTTEPGAMGSKRNVDSNYKTKVTTLSDGTIKRETFRTDAKGNNGVKVQEVSVKDGKLTNEITSNATAAERRDLNNPDSKLRKSIRNQTEDAGDPGAAAADKKNQDIAGGGSGNNADTPPETGDNSKPSNKPDNIKEDSGTRNSFGDFNYPITRDPKQDIIKFDMLKYEKRQVEGATFKKRSAIDDRKSIGSVMLPIPGGISDSNSCGWGDDTMDPLKLAAASAALAALGQNDADGGLKGALGDVFSQVKSNNESIKKAIGTTFAAQAVGADANALMSRVGGMVMNPNLELLFQGPSLRPFSFQFKMSPRSADEAKMITQIIRFFKQGMAPIRDESKLFLRTPHTFRIKYIQMGPDSDRSKFLNEFKECALTGCSVQYTPEGNYAPYEDGAMSSYQMTLQFKELTPIYNDDYGNSGNLPAAIGF